VSARPARGGFCIQEDHSARHNQEPAKPNSSCVPSGRKGEKNLGGNTPALLGGGGGGFCVWGGGLTDQNLAPSPGVATQVRGATKARFCSDRPDLHSRGNSEGPTNWKVALARTALAEKRRNVQCGVGLGVWGVVGGGGGVDGKRKT